MKKISRRVIPFIILIAFVLPQPAMGARIAGEPAKAGEPQAVQEKTDSREAPNVKEAAPKEKPAPQRRAARNSKTAAKSAAKKKREGKFVTIDFDNVDIPVFVKFISEITGKNFVVDSNVKGKVTIFSPRKISIDEAYKVFESVLEVHGFTTVPSGDIIKVIPSKDAKEKSIETRLARESVTPGDKVVTQIIPLSFANPDEMKKVLDPLISRSSVIMSYPPSGMLVVTDVMSNIRRLQEIVKTLDVEGVGEQISVIPVRHAAAGEIAKSLNVIFQADTQAAQRRGVMSSPIRILADERTNMLVVVANEGYTGRIKELIAMLDREVPRGESMMHVYRLQNANAEDLAKILMALPKDGKPAERGKAPVLSKDVLIVADKATNTLVITAARDDYKVLEDVIAKLDINRSMVYIEALIMEVSVMKNFKVGVEWRTMQDIGKAPGFDTGRLGAFGGSGGLGAGGGYNLIPDGLPSFPGGFSFGVLGAGLSIAGVHFPNIGAVIQAMQRDSDVHILSTPQILTMDNEEAEITVGKNVPYVTRQEQSSSGIDYSNYEYRDVGVLLNITPHINEEGQVKLKIQQQVTQVIAEESKLGLPTTLKRTAKTTVVVKDKDSVVIGGIIGDSTEQATHKAPCLGDIPLLGNLFKSKSRSREKTNLFVFLTPHIIRSKDEMNALTKHKQEHIDGLMKGGEIKLYGGEKKPVPPPSNTQGG